MPDGEESHGSRLETLLNVLYLLELEANNPEHVRRYLRLTDPAIETLLTIFKAISESGNNRM